MKKEEIKVLEVKVAEILNVRSVKLVSPEEIKEDEVSVIEFPLAGKTPASSNLLSAAMDKAHAGLEKTAAALEQSDGPFQLLWDMAAKKSKAVRFLDDFFFVGKDFKDCGKEEADAGTYTIEDGHYDHDKADVVEDGKVVYLNKDFKDLK